MTRFQAALAAAALMLPHAGSAQDLSRADPALRFLLMNREALEAAPPPIEPQLAPDRATGLTAGLLEPALVRDAGPLAVRTLVKVGPGGESALVRAGASIGARAGDIVTARIPLDLLPDILAERSILAVEAATALRPLAARPGPVSGDLSDRSVAPSGPPPNDSANAASRFDELRRRVGERWEGLAGQGVVIGIYDSGLDLTHEDFLRPDGSSRVLFAWDQTAAGSGPGMVGEHTFLYGTECSTTAIDAGDCPMTDRIGHGTHVAGTAAGDGSATGRGQPAWRFPGGAPAADLIIVKGGDADYTADRLVDGVAYIFARARALGRPAVVNISLSSQQGPHDGTTLTEQALSALAGPGRILVSGSGNAGDHRNTAPPLVNGPNHAEGIAGGVAQGVRVRPYTPRPGEVNDGVLLELWYGGGDSLAITVTTPRGEALTVATGDSATLETASGAIALMNAVDGPSPTNGDHAALLAILDADAAVPPDTGLWEIRVDPVAIHEDGGYHVWLTLSLLNGPVPPGLAGHPTNRYLVGIPASADRVLATGAHVTRHQWLGVSGGPELFPANEAMGELAYFSSPGPRRDGVLKPDLTAPGKVLISSLSKDAILWDRTPWLVEADSVHVGLWGTSMAAPHLAGAVAVLLQLEPTLTPEEARDALRLSAAADAHVPSRLPDPAWGAGKLDAAAAAERVRPDGLPAAGATVALSANPVRSDALVISYSEPPRSIAIYTLVAERVRSFTGTEIGPLTTVWPLDTDAGGDVANGAYVLVVELDDRRVVRKLLVARP